MLKRLISIFFILIFSCNTTHKKSPERVIYTNEIVEIIGKDAGLPEYLNKLNLSIENKIGYERDFFIPFNDYLKFNLEKYGIKTGNNLSDAGLVDIKIVSLNTKEMIIETNFYNILYTLEVYFSLYDEKTNFLQKDKLIKEYVLVFDTNSYREDYVLNYMSQLSARHIVEAIKFGWQEDFSKTADKIIILGGVVETNFVTNRRK